jgi:beta-lactamase class A
MLDLPVGSHKVVVTFCSQERGGQARVIAIRTADRFWVLPPSSLVASPARPVDRTLSKRLSSASTRFGGYSAVWFHDLRTGRAAGWNAEARFPAASTVKLGVLIAALRALGQHPERGRFAYDLESMMAWSSNLATNRLLRWLGRGSADAGARASERALRQLGARFSTFTGEYRLATSVARPSAQPPLVSSRVTTARDLGKVLFEIHAGAIGRRAALAALQLDQSRAQLALGLLLASEPVGDNVGLLRGFVPPSVPIAQKHGWLRDARHTSAIMYQPRGPEVVVVLTYRSGLPLGAASAYAGDVLEVLRGSRSG